MPSLRVSSASIGLPAAFLLLSGCFTANKAIPDHWSQPRRSDNLCRDVAGTYLNTGESSAGILWRANLADALTVQGHLANMVPTSLALRDSLEVMKTPCKECVTELRWLDPELKELQLTVRKTDSGQEIVRTLSTSKDHFRCSAIGLEVLYFQAYERVWTATYAKGSRVFTPASDGSLTMAEMATGFTRIAAILPLATEVTFFARWMPDR